MTETEWLACNDPKVMLSFLRCTRRRGRPSGRKLRLFVCACCRRISSLLTDERSRQAVAVAEMYVDGLASEETLWAAEKEAAVAYAALRALPDPAAYCAAAPAVEAVRAKYKPGYDCCVYAADVATMAPAVQATAAPKGYMYDAVVQSAERGVQAGLLRCICGNPFSPRSPLPRAVLVWNGEMVCRLAQVIYDERAFDRLPILADALEDAGCENADILNHCRHPGEHMRGCWVVDLLLGKL